METTSEATHAVETLDKALEEVSTAQAKLGAIQNRLQHNIDNLSKSSMLTEQSVGRIVDADFASETSELSKQQILAQAGDFHVGAGKPIKTISASTASIKVKM